MFVDIKAEMDAPIVREMISACAFDGTPEGVSTEVKKYRENERLQFYGWKQECGFVGICGFCVHAKKVEILLIAVSDTHRNQGVGRRMIDMLQEKYQRDLFAETYETEEESAVAFYQKTGFSCTAHPSPGWKRKWTCLLPVRKTTTRTSKIGGIGRTLAPLHRTAIFDCVIYGDGNGIDNKTASR
jgi:GNAT superfamily N-acetyltransferase